MSRSGRASEFQYFRVLGVRGERCIGGRAGCGLVDYTSCGVEKKRRFGRRKIWQSFVSD